MKSNNALLETNERRIDYYDVIKCLADDVASKTLLGHYKWKKKRREISHLRHVTANAATATAKSKLNI